MLNNQRSFVSSASVSPRGWASLQLEEGFRAKAYRDTRGILTIGYGHTMMGPSGVPFHEDSVWPEDLAAHVFHTDASYFIFSLNRDLLQTCTQPQFDAMFSMEYNIGMMGMQRSHLLFDFNKFGASGVIERDFMAWAHPPELTGRREREWAMFKHGVYRA